MIPFNKPYLSGNEIEYIRQAVKSGKISGNGMFTQRCHEFFRDRYGFRKCLLTSSCTDALEMAAILCGIEPGDEVIVPSFTFVSTANAFVLRGARIVFVDSRSDHPGMDEDKLEELITSKTKVIVPVHYAGVACDMDKIMEIANRHNLLVVEDAAQAIDSYYVDRKGSKRPLGSIGHLAAFSFHETKNIISGEGGMLVVNDDRFEKRSEIIWEKGTNRSAFWRGEVDKYGWVDIGSSFLPSEIVAAFLFAQLEQLDAIQDKRISIWNSYVQAFNNHGGTGMNFRLGTIPEYATNNAHLFYLLTKHEEARDRLISYLREEGIYAVFHYMSLHSSEYHRRNADLERLPFCTYYSNCLVRLPLYPELSPGEVDLIVRKVSQFYGGD